MNVRWLVGLLVVAVVVVLATGGVYTVKPHQRAAVLRFGEMEKVDVSPGLHFKWPLIESVRRFDGRILTDDPDAQKYRTSDGKSVTVEMSIKWKISNTNAFYRTTGGQEKQAINRLTQTVSDGVRTVLVQRTMTQLVNDSGQETLADQVRQRANKAVAKMGVKIVDVAIKGLQLPDKAQAAVINRMRADRQQFAEALRAKGKAAADNIRAQADRKRAELLSRADAKSEDIRGEGDAQASGIYARAYSQDPDFYRFYKSLEIYRKGWNQPGNVIVLSPGSDLLRYFRPPGNQH